MPEGHLFIHLVVLYIVIHGVQYAIQINYNIVFVHAMLDVDELRYKAYRSWGNREEKGLHS